MELLYIGDLKDEWLDFIYTFSQLLPGLVAGAPGWYVLCGVVMMYGSCANCMFHITSFLTHWGWNKNATSTENIFKPIFVWQLLYLVNNFQYSNIYPMKRV